MEQCMIPFDADYTDQLLTLNLTPDDESRALRVRLQYRDYVGKYFMSITDAVTDEDLLVNFPLVASEEEALNDLIKIIAYKAVGSIVCLPVIAHPTYTDPDGTISEYEVLWGDSLWQS